MCLSTFRATDPTGERPFIAGSGCQATPRDLWEEESRKGSCHLYVWPVDMLVREEPTGLPKDKVDLGL